MKKSPLLGPVERVIGAIKIQNQPLGRLLKGGDELLDPKPIECPGYLAIGLMFKPT